MNNVTDAARAVLDCAPEDRAKLDAWMARLSKADRERLDAEMERERRRRAMNGSTSTLLDMHEPGSDAANAVEFVTRHEGEFLHVALWGEWRRWDGTRYAPDETSLILEAALHFLSEVRDRFHRKGDARKRERLGSARTARACLDAATADRRAARHPNDFDKDSLGLNTPGAFVKLMED